VHDDGRSPGDDTASLSFRQESDRRVAGVLSEADEAEADVGLVALLIEIQPDERASDTIVSHVPRMA
jgi:hypothetical protein